MSYGSLLGLCLFYVPMAGSCMEMAYGSRDEENPTERKRVHVTSSRVLPKHPGLFRDWGVSFSGLVGLRSLGPLGMGMSRLPAVLSNWKTGHGREIRETKPGSGSPLNRIRRVHFDYCLTRNFNPSVFKYTQLRHDLV